MRYLRANTSPKALCPTCGEKLILLRWCHEERCEAFTRRRRERVVRVGLALLGLCVLVLVSPFLVSP